MRLTRWRPFLSCSMTSSRQPGSHNAADGDDLVEPEGARLAANVALQQLDGLDDRLVGVIVRAKLKCVEQWRQQAAVVRLIRTTHCLVELTAIARSSGLVLADQVAQDALTTDGGENDVPHDAVGSFDRGLGHAEQQPSLASDAAKVRQKLLLDPVLSGGVDPLDGLDECVDQVVSQLTGAMGCPGRQQRRAHRLGMPTQFVGSSTCTRWRYPWRALGATSANRSDGSPIARSRCSLAISASTLSNPAGPGSVLSSTSGARANSPSETDDLAGVSNPSS